MIYDLLLNCKNTTATMNIITSNKRGTAMANVFLKRRKHYENYSKILKKIFIKISGRFLQVFFSFIQVKHLRSYKSNASFVGVLIVVVGSIFVDDPSSLMETSL